MENEGMYARLEKMKQYEDIVSAMLYGVQDDPKFSVSPRITAMNDFIIVKYGELSIEKYRMIVDKIESCGLNLIRISGGENKDFVMTFVETTDFRELRQRIEKIKTKISMINGMRSFRVRSEEGGTRFIVEIDHFEILSNDLDRIDKIFEDIGLDQFSITYSKMGDYGVKIEYREW